MSASAQTIQPTAADRRHPQAPQPLAAQTIMWMAGLPARMRPRRLPVEFTRIANAVAQNWNDPPACALLLDELLVDRRGSRQGFPMEIMLELAGLKDFYETVLHPQPQTVWDDIVNRGRLA